MIMKWNWNITLKLSTEKQTNDYNDNKVELKHHLEVFINSDRLDVVNIEADKRLQW